ncbi:unnamed protein product [Brassica oleracea var. botrytis]
MQKNGTYTPPPPQGKPNDVYPSCWVDGAWDAKTLCGGAGWTIKATNMTTLCKDSTSRSHVSSALVSEVMAVKHALRSAAALGLVNLNLFSDSQVLISTLHSGSDLNEIAGLLLDIRNLASLFNHLSFSHVSRTCNVLADSLAKSALAKLVADLTLFGAP